MMNYGQEVNTIFIILGTGCNMNCKYCLQHPLLIEKKEIDIINPDIFEFMINCLKNNKKGIHIQFFGGEPLIYFKNLRYIMNKLYDINFNNKKFSFGIISNGKAITDEMTDYLNIHNVPVTISWDGKNTEKTRNYDVFSNKELKEKIFKLKFLGLSAVMSSYAYPKDILDNFYELSEEYAKLHSYIMTFNIDDIFDTGLEENRDLLDIDYNKVSEQINYLLEYYIENINKNEKKKYTYIDYISKKINLIKNFVNNKGKIYNTCYCGNGYNTINIDLNGNLYSCHNTNVSCGNINNNYEEYHNKIIELDSTKENNKICSSCYVYPICKSGCKLVSSKAREETYCKLKHSINDPIMEFMYKLGSKNLKKD